MVEVKRVKEVRPEHAHMFTKDSFANARTLRSIVIRYQYIEYKCERCGNTGEWQGEPMPLELHHINNSTILPNNEIYNLKWLCPNCHNIEPSTSINRKKDRPSLGDTNTKDDLLKAYAEHASIRQALLSCGFDQRNSALSSQMTIWINQLGWPRRENGGIIPNIDSLSEDGKVILEKWAEEGFIHTKYYVNKNAEKFFGD